MVARLPKESDVPETLAETENPELHAVARGDVLAPAAARPAARPAPAVHEREARDDLRHQIARLELELGALFASAFPRREIDWRVGSVGGPRVLPLAELERVRDALAFRVGEARAEIARRADLEEANRGMLEAMIVAPERHRWVRVSNEDIGEDGCRHWHSRPRWGIVGMLLGWWRVKLSSGCPLPVGRGPAAPRPARRT